MNKQLPILFFLLFSSFGNLVFSQCGFSVSTTATHVACYNGTTGSITVTVTGGTGPFQYQLAEAGAGAWQGSNVFTALLAGTYPVSVRDASQCITTVYATVNQPAALVATYTATDPTCAGSSNGLINTTITGGTAPYGFSWTRDGAPYATTQNLTGLNAANYLLIVTDASGCSTSPIIAQQIKPLSVTGFNEDIVANGTNAAPATVTSNEIDSGPGNVFFSTGYTNASGENSTGGLPASGAFPSEQAAERTYQLAAYTGSNALVLRSGTDGSYGGATSGTLSFATQHRSLYSTFYVIGTTGSGTGTMNYTVNYSDATTSTGSMTFPDWFLEGASVQRALGLISRVNKSSGAFDGRTSFNLFEVPITISGANQGKTVMSVSFSWSGTDAARTSIMAITGYTSTAYGIRINDGAASSVSPAVSITSNASSNEFCTGQAVTFTPAPVNGGNSPTYQWQLNGSNVATGPTYTNSSLANGNTVRAIMTASGGVTCLSTTTANSNIITMTLGTKAAAVTTAASSTSICTGNEVVFTASPVNGGVSPSYQWRVNGSNVATGPVFTSSSINNADAVTVQMTSSIGCATGNPATSTPINMTVQPYLQPTVSITSVPAVTFSSVISNGGTTPAYQWFKNGTPIGGATNATYTTNTAVIGDVFSLRLTSNYACRTAPASMSNYINVSNITLPVTLESFTAQAVDNSSVLLKWKTATETNAKQFLLQRAAGNGVFKDIATIAALNTATGFAYAYTDLPGAGSYQYRLAQQDADGRLTYLATRAVVLTGNSKWTVADRHTSWLIQTSEFYTYRLLDIQGRTIEQGTINGSKTINKPSGAAVYVLRMEKDGKTSVQKLIK